jgi:hypothetical protein
MGGLSTSPQLLDIELVLKFCSLLMQILSLGREREELWGHASGTKGGLKGLKIGHRMKEIGW